MASSGRQMISAEGISLDHIRVLLAVVEQGSFSGAARALNRAQSAVTYAMQRLEEQVGTELFDRAGYRPVLSEAGRALLPRARRIAEEMSAFRAQARGIVGGLEPELAIAADALFPLPLLVAALGAFSARFPTVSTRLYVEPLDAATRLVREQVCTLGLLAMVGGADAALRIAEVASVELLPVVAPGHPLAAEPPPIPTETLRQHVQLVLTDRAGGGNSPDHGVLSTRTWRLGDLGAKHALLRAGLGWGNMPRPMVADDLRRGRLRAIRPEAWEGAGGRVRLAMHVAHRADQPLRPAAQWLFAHLLAAGG